MNETAASPASQEDVRPVVRRGAGRDIVPWIAGAVILLAGIWVFITLNTGREDEALAIDPSASDEAIISAPPRLSLPPGFAQDQGPAVPLLAAPQLPPARAQQVAEPEPRVETRIVEREVPVDLSTPALPVSPSFPRPEVVFDPPITPPTPTTTVPSENADRVEAGRLLNPSYTVPQGAVLAAVLETALDSTRAGAVRAIISRDVMSFDGSRVLIPRGSRLYGEYSSEVGRGQKRALVNWTRLTRPDAVIVNLNSPAADPLGRAGIEGDLDTHFFDRFGSAILQSVLDIGVGVATRAASDDAVVVALPGSTQNITGVPPEQITPTLKVKQGTSVSVFVARDLDFSRVDR